MIAAATTLRHGLCLLLLLLPLSSAAGKISVPESIAGVTTLDAEGVIELAERLPGLIIIDARQRMDRRQGYIQGSVSLPDVETRCDSLKTVLATSDTPALFYCNGVNCGRSVIALEVAKGCGYTQLYWFRWKRPWECPCV